MYQPDAYTAFLNRELANDEAREIPSYLTSEQADQIADEIRAKAEMSEAAAQAAAQDRADLIALRNYTQCLELRYAEVIDELAKMTERRDGLANLIAKAYSNRWSNPAEYGVQRFTADLIEPARLRA